eukprot:gene8900-848_t
MEWKAMKPEKMLLPSLSGHSMISVKCLQSEEDCYQFFIVIFGGRNSQNKLTNNSYLYDPVQNLFIDVQNLTNQKKSKKNAKKILPEIRERHTLTVLGDKKKSILFGGLGTDEKNERYFPLNDLWSLTINFEMKTVNWVKLQTKEIPTARYDHTMVFYSLNPQNNFTILFGGYGTNKTEFNDTWIIADKKGSEFDVMKVIHREGVKKPPARYQHTAVVQGKQMFIYGGKSKNQVLNDLWIFDCETFQYREVEMTGIPVPPRHAHSAVITQNYMLVFGGRSNDGKYSNHCYAFDTEHYNWTRIYTINEQKIEELPNGGILSSFCVFPYDVLQVVLFGGLRMNSKKLLERSFSLWTLDTGFTNETDKISKYEIISILGSGSNSTVYCVKDEDLVALKRIRLFQQDTNINQYTTLNDLDHENILIPNQKNFENKNGLNGKVTYLQMIEPYCELGNLTKYLTPKSPKSRYKKKVTEEELINIAIQIVKGLNYLHSKNIIHGNIKPQNVLLTRKVDKVQKSNPIVKLADYGLSSTNEFFIGGNYYFAPENDNMTFESDIWQLGTLLFYLFSGKTLDFKIETNLTLIKASLEEKELKYSSFYLKLIESCLRKDPKERITGNGLIKRMKENQEISSSIQKYFIEASLDDESDFSNIRLPTAVVPNFKDVSAWLVSIGFENYIEKFQENGIESLSDCKKMKQQEVEKIFEKYGHQKKFLWRASKIPLA